MSLECVHLGLVAPHLMTFSKMSFCIAYQACSSVSMHALNTHDAPLGPQPPLRPQFSRGYCHRTALHVGSKRASNRAPKHHLCALEAHFALFPGTQSIPYLRYRRAYHTAIEDRPLSKYNIDLLRCTSYTRYRPNWHIFGTI